MVTANIDLNVLPLNRSEDEITIEKETITESKLLEEKTTLEDLLRKLKLTGRYHIQLFLLLCSLLLMNSGSAVNYIFAVENINFRCKYAGCGETELLTLEQNSTLDFKCRKYELLTHNGTCTEDDFDESNATDCKEWIYDRSDSFVAEFNLGCEQWKRTLVGTMHSTGYMIGLLFVGPLSDKFGRKKMIIFNTFFCGVVGMTKSIATSYWMYIALEMLEPMFGENYSSLYTLGVEMMTTENRPTMIFIFTVCGTFADIAIAFLGYLSSNWRMFLKLLYLPTFFSILYIFWLDESLRWLLIKGKKAEAEKIIRKAIKLNNITIDDSIITNLKYEGDEGETSASLKASLKVTFSSRKLFIRLILCVCLWLTGLFNGYSLLVNSVSLEGNKYVNYGLVSISTVSSGIILLFILTKFKRKEPLIFALMLTGIFCVSQSFVPKGYRWLSILLYICGKINASIALKIVYLYTTELFPTYTRNTMLCLCSSLGRIGAGLALQTPLLLRYWSGLPSFLVGITSLVTASIVTLMPDTSQNVLPDDVKQAEAIGDIKLKKRKSIIL